MTKRILGGTALLITGVALTACAVSTSAVVETEGPRVSASASPTPTAEAEQPRGTRQNPIPFSESVTFEDPEGGGPTWTVTIDEPRDMGPEILAEAIELYGDDDESYLAPSRPEPGTFFLGYTGTVERLSDAPASPGYDLETALIGTDGNTYNMIVLVGGPEEALFNIAEMYSPATARFSDVQAVPEGVTWGQVLVTLESTGERVYFGTPPS